MIGRKRDRERHTEATRRALQCRNSYCMYRHRYRSRCRYRHRHRYLLYEYIPGGSLSASAARFVWRKAKHTIMPMHRCPRWEIRFYCFCKWAGNRLFLLFLRPVLPTYYEMFLTVSVSDPETLYLTVSVDLRHCFCHVGV